MLRAFALLLLGLFIAQEIVLGSNLCSASANDQGLDLDCARQYMVELINNNRATFGLAPLELDCLANKVAQAHSKEMAQWKFVSHWNLQGKKPEQRYSEFGGQGAVSENVLLTHDFIDGEKYRLTEHQLFSRKELRHMQTLFFNESPPNDEHRNNILNPHHNKVGIGLIRLEPGNRILCTQEFVNQYGSFSKLPDEERRGANLALSGKLAPGVSLYSIDIYRDHLPQPMNAKRLKATHSYPLPTENIARYFPPPYLSPTHVNVTRTAEGEEFYLDVKAEQDWKPGLYYMLIWVKTAGFPTPVVTSAQTVALN